MKVIDFKINGSIFIITLITLTSFISVSCHQKNQKTITIEKIEIDKAETLYKWVKDSCIITKSVILKNYDRDLIGDISKLIFHENKYFIYDGIQRKIFVYDSNGNFLNFIGSYGKGPGEYLEIRDFQIYNGQLYLLDYNYLRIYSFDGNFIKNIKLNKLSDITRLNPVQFGITKDSKFLFWIGNFGNTEIKEVLFITNSELKLLNKYFTFYDQYPDSFRFNSNKGDMVFSGLMGDYNLYTINDTYCVPKYLIDFGKQAVQTDNTKDKQKLYDIIDQNNLVHSLREIYTTPNYISFIYQKGRTPYMGFYNKKTKIVRTDNCINPIILGGAMIRGTHEKQFILYYPINTINSKEFIDFTHLNVPEEINNPVLIHIELP